jgi:hypothetical protein
VGDLHGDVTGKGCAAARVPLSRMAGKGRGEAEGA